MSPLPSPTLPLLALLAVLALLGAAPPTIAEVMQAVWHRMLVSQAQLDAAASKSFQVADEILCAVVANSFPSCHLLTYQGTTCVLYDVEVDSVDATTDDATTLSKIRNPKMCIVGGVSFPHGATLEHDCIPSICLNGAIIPHITGVWVGVRARKWLNGRDVANDEWGEPEPDGAMDYCGRMMVYDGIYKLADMDCGRSHVFLCKKGM